MFKGSDWNQIVIAILAIGILILSGYVVYSSKAQAADATVDVSGSANLMADPDKVEIYFTVETNDNSANVSQTMNSEIMQEVRSALADLGLKAGDMETTSYYLYPVREYDKNGTLVLMGYRTTHSIKVTLNDLEKTGAVADAAVGAGANRVDNIVFGLSDSKLEIMKQQAVNNSIDNAKQKAESMAAKMNVKLVKVKHFSESYYYTPVYKGYDSISEMASSSTDITPGQVEISASVSVTYQIE